MLLETVQTRKAVGGQKVTIHAQVRVPAWTRPIGQLGVDTFTVHHQRAHQTNVLAFELAHQLRGNALCGLRLHRSTVVRAMLCAKLDIEQAQKMPHLGGGAHSRFASPTAQTLLNRHRGWNAIHRVHLGPPGGLHDAARIGVQTFQITSLPFIEQNIKRERGLARPRHSRDDVELAPWNVDTQTLEVVLFGVDDLNRTIGHRRAARSFGKASRTFSGQQTCGGFFAIYLVHHAHGSGIVAQSFARVRGGVQAHLFGRAFGHQQAARIPAFGAEVNQPIAGTDNVEVVLNDDERVAVL